MKEKLLNSYLYVFDNEPYEITTEANGIYIQEEFVKEFAYINPSLVSKMIPINYYVIKANTPEWYSYMVSTEPQPAPLGPDSSLPDNPELVVDGDNITVSEYGNKFMLFSNPNKLKNVMYNSTNVNVAYFSSDQEGQVEIAGPGTTLLSQEFAGDDEYLPFSKSYNLEVEDITVDPEIAWSQNSATVQIGETNSFPTISNPHNVGLTFASSDESVATVNQETGEVSLVAAGNCTIACISIQDADYYSSTVEYSLTVLAAKVNPDLTWSFSPATVQIGETNLFPVLQNGDSVSPIVYSSSNESVATVDSSTGAVTLVAAGSCYITASFAGNTQYNAYTISYELTVLSAKVDPGFHYRQGTGTYDIYTEIASVPPLDNPNAVSPITYSSSDTSVATVNSDGTINYLAVGTTTITASFAGNTQYLPLSDSFVLTISDSRPLEDNISFDGGDSATKHPFEQFDILVNDPDNVGWSITTQPTDAKLQVAKTGNVNVGYKISVCTTTTPAGTYTFSITSQGSNPKTLTYTINIEAYPLSMSYNYIYVQYQNPSISSYNDAELQYLLILDNNDNNLYTVLDTANGCRKEYPQNNIYTGWYYLANSLEIRDVSTNQAVSGLIIERVYYSGSDNKYGIIISVSSNYVQDDNRNLMLCIKDNQPFIFTDIANNAFYGNFKLTGGYTIPKEYLTGQFYDEMNQSTISSISIDGSDSMSLPSYDRYQLKFTDYTGNLANELNISDLTVTSPDPNCTITVRNKVASGNDIFFWLGINSTVNVSGNITISTPDTTHFHSSSTSIPLTITGIKPALTLISKNVPTNITPGQTVNCSWQFEVPYGFRWNGEYYTEANAWLDGSQKYSPGSPTPTFTYDDQATITIMEVSFSATLDSSAPVGGSAYINFDLDMSRTYANYSDRTNQTVVSATPTTDPDIYFDNSEITLNYYTDHSKLDGNRKTQSLRGDNKDDTTYITWSTSDTTIATVQGNGYVIAHGNGTVNITVNYAAHDNYNSKTVQYQLTITNYKLYSSGQWYNNGDPISYIEVSKGGSNTYSLTFSGTPSDSWTFSILESETINGISVDATGTITIDESQLNTLGSFAIEARRQTDASYYEGLVTISINIKQASKALSVLSNSFVNVSEDSTTSETFTIGHLDFGDHIINTADLQVTFDTSSGADITLNNVSITYNDLATETDVNVSFDLSVLKGVVQGDTITIYAQLTDNGSGYYMERMPVGNISLNSQTQTINIDTTRFNARSNNNGGIYFDLYSDLQINSIETYTMSDDYVNSLLQLETYTSDGIYNYKNRVDMPNEKGILDAATVECKLIINNAGVGVGPITKNISFANPLI